MMSFLSLLRFCVWYSVLGHITTYLDKSLNTISSPSREGTPFAPRSKEVHNYKKGSGGSHKWILVFL